MADNKNKRHPQDATRINMNEEYEVRYLTKKLGVSREELKRATSKFGSVVSRLRERFRKN